ncbi:hypothetical protein CBR_g3911 [Chara braunii]|uniref:Molybdate-anion transporter n=1 Tax=Chara braunii TaxID=69332 RepID=A0A388KGP0_CHABU|nr:hypothetical protein CBR_g3911 [Chara braunii]|eukprot:GBG69212.1 hypothetical protein CBR_g3911 [Chara braunii]
MGLTYFYSVFGILSVICFFLETTKTPEDKISTSSVFNSFKNNYIFVYCLMMAGDWLQGPYVYALYQYYNYDRGDIGRLFIAGFGSSMVFGTVVGSLADKHGRKAASITYCITYILSCFTKHSSKYGWLLLGRVLGGISTSLLFSAFESWLVSEHIKRGFEPNWLSVSFSKAIFLGNGLVAIFSGLLANTLVVDAGLGPVAPFDAAVCVLAIGMTIIAFTWTENYGDPSEGKNLIRQFATAAKLIAADEKIALLGAIQSLFESSMYTFIFLWTPALGSETKFGLEIPHGFVFATFMLASMIGSSLASRLLARPFLRVERYMQFVFLVASASLLLPTYAGYFDEHSNNVAAEIAADGISPGGRIQMAGFLIFEVCVGIFWPSMMKMRSDYVPEESRSTIMNFFRIPLNMFVCIVLYNVSVFPISSMFATCAALLVAAALLTRRLLVLSTTDKARSRIEQWRAEAKHQRVIAAELAI